MEVTIPVSELERFKSGHVVSTYIESNTRVVTDQMITWTSEEGAGNARVVATLHDKDLGMLEVFVRKES